MPINLDPEFAAIMAPFAEAAASAPKPAVGDVQAIRGAFEPMLAAGNSARARYSEVDKTLHHATSPTDGHRVPVYQYLPKGRVLDKNNPSPAVLHMHAGGLIVGSVANTDADVIEHVLATGIPFFSVDYRLAPEHPYPASLNDSYAALLWLRENAPRLGVDPARLAVMGESAGGNLAAGVSLLARDAGLSPPIARQVLVYPMLDDRTQKQDPLLEPVATWSTDSNITAWRAVLGNKAGTSEEGYVPGAAAPSREKNLEGLPAAFIDVGTLDIFRDEDAGYAIRLAKAGVDTEFHLYPGLPHGFDSLAPQIEGTKAANRLRRAVLAKL